MALARAPAVTPRRTRTECARRIETPGAKRASVDEYAAMIARRIVDRNERDDMPGAVYDGALDVLTRFRDVRGAVIDFTDRGFTRGHAVFDAATIVGGRAHLLERHLERFGRNAERAGLASDGLGVDRVREVVMETIEAAAIIGCGQVRVYATSGSDGMNFSLMETRGVQAKSTLFVVAYAKDPIKCAASEDCVGMRAVSSPVTIKPPQYATLKSTNYLNNVNAAQHARTVGADVGIFLTREGMIGEAPGANVAFLTPDGTLRTPPATEILGGITIGRVKEFIENPSNATELRAVGVKRFDDTMPLSPFVVLGASEVMLIGSAVNIQGIVEWDSKVIGDGSVGPATRLLAKFLVDDMAAGSG